MNEKEERDYLEESFAVGLVSVMVYLGLSRGLYLFEPTMYGLALTLASALLVYFFLVFGGEVFPQSNENKKELSKPRPVINHKKLQNKPRPVIQPKEPNLKQRPVIKPESLKPKSRPVINKNVQQVKSRPEIKKVEDYSMNEVKSRLEERQKNRRIKK